MGDKVGRRDFLRGVGILGSAATTTVLIEGLSFAQDVLQTGTKSMTYRADEIIDFHSHHIPARFEVTAGRTAPATQRARRLRLRPSSACRCLYIPWPHNRSPNRWLPMGSSGLCSHAVQ